MSSSSDSESDSETFQEEKRLFGQLLIRSCFPEDQWNGFTIEQRERFEKQYHMYDNCEPLRRSIKLKEFLRLANPDIEDPENPEGPIFVYPTQAPTPDMFGYFPQLSGKAWSSTDYKLLPSEHEKIYKAIQNILKYYCRSYKRKTESESLANQQSSGSSSTVPEAEANTNPIPLTENEHELRQPSSSTSTHPPTETTPRHHKSLTSISTIPATSTETTHELSQPSSTILTSPETETAQGHPRPSSSASTIPGYSCKSWSEIELSIKKTMKSVLHGNQKSCSSTSTTPGYSSKSWSEIEFNIKKTMKSELVGSAQTSSSGYSYKSWSEIEFNIKKSIKSESHHEQPQSSSSSSTTSETETTQEPQKLYSSNLTVAETETTYQHQKPSSPNLTITETERTHEEKKPGSSNLTLPETETTGEQQTPSSLNLTIPGTETPPSSIMTNPETETNTNLIPPTDKTESHGDQKSCSSILTIPLRSGTSWADILLNLKKKLETELQGQEESSSSITSTVPETAHGRQKSPSSISTIPLHSGTSWSSVASNAECKAKSHTSESQSTIPEPESNTNLVSLTENEKSSSSMSTITETQTTPGSQKSSSSIVTIPLHSGTSWSGIDVNAKKNDKNVLPVYQQPCCSTWVLSETGKFVPPPEQEKRIQPKRKAPIKKYFVMPRMKLPTPTDNTIMPPPQPLQDSSKALDNQQNIMSRKKTKFCGNALSAQDVQTLFHG